MERPGRKPRAEDLRGRNRSGRREHICAPLDETVDKRQKRQTFAEARAMQPDETAGGTSASRFSETLTEPGRVFLASRRAPPERRSGERRRELGGETVKGEKRHGSPAICFPG